MVGQREGREAEGAKCGRRPSPAVDVAVGCPMGIPSPPVVRRQVVAHSWGQELLQAPVCNEKQQIVNKC